jgi:hypothetical protein
MLDAERMDIAEGVQLVSIEGTRHGFEIARSAQPAIDRARACQSLGEVRAGCDLGGAAGNRSKGGRQGEEVDMMIVKPWNEGSAECIDFAFSWTRRDAIAELDDQSFVTAKIDAAVADFGIVDQQSAVHSSIRRSLGAVNRGACPRGERARGFSIVEVWPASTTHQP